MNLVPTNLYVSFIPTTKIFWIRSYSDLFVEWKVCGQYTQNLLK